MTGIYVLFAGMAIFAVSVTAMDWIARRQERASAPPLFKELAVRRNSK